MSDQITKKDLEEILDKKLEEKLDQKLTQYQTAIIEAVDFKFQKTDTKINILTEKVITLEQRMDGFDRKLDRLTTTLDNFLKRLTDREDEFTILKAEVDQIKAVFKEKFGVEILVQGR